LPNSTHGGVNVDLLKRDFYVSIVLTGGYVAMIGFSIESVECKCFYVRRSSMFPGLKDRLQKELRMIIPSTMPLNVVESQERKYGAWIGGSIFTSLGYFEDVVATQQGMCSARTFALQPIHHTIYHFFDAMKETGSLYSPHLQTLKNMGPPPFIGVAACTERVCGGRLDIQAAVALQATHVTHPCLLFQKHLCINIGAQQPNIIF
jgi:hypothetical protein